MWVRSEYAGELAVLSAWLSALLPWNVTLSSFGSLGSVLFVRFPLFQVQYNWTKIGGTLPGVKVVNRVWVADPLTTSQFYAGGPSGVANLVWAVGGGCVALAVVLSFALYLREDRVERGPVDPVRAMGALLGVGALAFTASTYLFWTRYPGVPIPVGLPVLYLLAGTLLTVDRTAAPAGADAGASGE